MCIGSRYVSLDHVENLPILWFAMLWKQLPSLAIILKLLFFKDWERVYQEQDAELRELGLR